MDKLFESILNAPVYDVAIESPLEFASKLSQRLNNRVYMKREDMQPVFSFKIRGAYAKMARLPQESLACGVIAASAGNHAQGVAMSAKKLGCRAIIVMPQMTPLIKVQAVRALGGEVLSHGANFDEAAEYAQKHMREHGYTFVHPYDDWDVIAGQGTIGMEILRQLRDTQAVFVSVGGGGLIAGIATYIKRLRPEIKIIGVEPADSACMTMALQSGKRVVLPHVGRFADGVAVKQAGEKPFKVCRKFVDRMLTVSTEEICAAIKDTFEDNRSILEPAGAVALAGLKKYCQQTGVKNQHLVAINTGANTDFDRLRFIADRAEMGEAREALFAVTIPEKPGSYLAFCKMLGKRSISEFNYRMSSAKTAHIFVGVTIKDKEDSARLMEQFKKAELPVLNLTDNELAKTHLRHMVGGHSQVAQNERLFRFEFPESPGALLYFLQSLSGRWNISLFHYRNNGGVIAEVLVGLQVPASDKAALRQFLDAVGYPYTSEESNPAYQLFLQGGAPD